MRYSKFKIYTFICIIPLILILVSSSAMAAYVGSSYISSQGACVMDYDTGEVYYEYNGHTPRVPASITKLMNLYCVYEAMSEAKFGFETNVPISANVYSKSRNPVYQTVPLHYNTAYTVDELIGMVVTYSDIGSAVALAELVAGSEWAFVQIMNQKAKELGIDAYFYDCFGVSNNKITPIGIAVLAKNFISKYPDILARSAKRSVTFHGTTYRSTNHLFDTHYYPGADGLKTGTTSAAGFCFCATAAKDGRRMIAVTMASSSSSQRFADAANLLNFGFSSAATKYSTLYYTDTAAMINNAEIPVFAHMGNLVIVAQDLANYGFDVSYDDSVRTLYLIRNPNKQYTPLSVEQFKNKEWQKASQLINTDIKVVVIDGDKTVELANTYAMNGYMCMILDDLKNLYYIEWDGTTRRANVIIPQA